MRLYRISLGGWAVLLVAVVLVAAVPAVGIAVAPPVARDALARRARELVRRAGRVAVALVGAIGAVALAVAHPVERHAVATGVGVRAACEIASQSLNAKTSI